MTDALSDGQIALTDKATTVPASGAREARCCRSPGQVEQLENGALDLYECFEPFCKGGIAWMKEEVSPKLLLTVLISRQSQGYKQVIIDIDMN